MTTSQRPQRQSGAHRCATNSWRPVRTKTQQQLGGQEFQFACLRARALEPVCSVVNWLGRTQSAERLRACPVLAFDLVLSISIQARAFRSAHCLCSRLRCNASGAGWLPARSKLTTRACVRACLRGHRPRASPAGRTRKHVEWARLSLCEFVGEPSGERDKR